MSQPAPDGAPDPPPQAAQLFGDRLPAATTYAEALAGAGTVRGLIGPREVPRLWDRHLLNCAAVADLLPIGVDLLDMGSGAGLPGIPLALARPDLRITLLDSVLRRTTFLTEIVELLDLSGRVRVVRARAEEHRERYGAVTARAVADLAVLGRWAAPLARPGGLLVAIRGASAAAELEGARNALSRDGWQGARVAQCGASLGPPTTVVLAERAEPVTGAARRARGKRD